MEVNLESLHLTPPAASVIGMSLGEGIIVYKIVKSGMGLARVEIGRTRFRYAASPSYLPCLAATPRFIAVPEFPLYINMKSVMGLTRFDSDDDDDTNNRCFYLFSWRPEVSGKVGGEGGGRGRGGALQQKGE